MVFVAKTVLILKPNNIEIEVFNIFDVNSESVQSFLNAGTIVNQRPSFKSSSKQTTAGSKPYVNTVIHLSKHENLTPFQASGCSFPERCALETQ